MTSVRRALLGLVVVMLSGCGWLVWLEFQARHREEVKAWRLIALRNEDDRDELRSRILHAAPLWRREDTDFPGCHW